MFDSYSDTDLDCQGIYAIVNGVNGRVYIGQTMRSFRSRWSSHRDYLIFNRHYNTGLQSDWNELGSNAFQWSIVHKFAQLHPCYQQAMSALERVMIVTAESWLYNATKRRLYRNDEELISWLYTRRFDEQIAIRQATLN